MVLKTVFIGTAPFGFPVMRRLKEHSEIELLGVISQPDRKRGRGQSVQSPPVADYARELELPLHQPENINDEGLKILRGFGEIDISFVVAYGQFLSPEVYEFPIHGSYNFHASLLPRWRGAAPIRHAMLAGDGETGVSIFRLEEGMDTGPVCDREVLDIGDDENYGQLYEKLSNLNVIVLDRFIEQLLEGTSSCEPQEGEPTYAPMIQSEDSRIDWSQPAQQVERHIRAFCPDPGAFTEYEGKRLKIYQATVVSGVSGQPPGTVLRAGEEQLHVKASDGAVSIEELQPSGSRRMDVQAYLAGQPDLSPGERLN